MHLDVHLKFTSILLGAYLKEGIDETKISSNSMRQQTTFIKKNGLELMNESPRVENPPVSRLLLALPRNLPKSRVIICMGSKSSQIACPPFSSSDMRNSECRSGCRRAGARERTYKSRWSVFSPSAIKPLPKALVLPIPRIVPRSLTRRGGGRAREGAGAAWRSWVRLGGLQRAPALTWIWPEDLWRPAVEVVNWVRVHAVRNEIVDGEWFDSWKYTTK